MSEWMLLASCLSATLVCAVTAQAEDAKAPSPAGVYELRTYTTLPGRLPALHKRFQEHTLKLFEKHGMKNVIYFTPNDKPDTLVYLLHHQSVDAAKKSWDAFRADPVWKAAKEASEKDGAIVKAVEVQFLTTTPYSPK